MTRVVREKLKVGDVVELNSGGPLMTVSVAGATCEVAWFDGEGSQAAAFPPAALTKRETPKSRRAIDNFIE